MASLLHGDRGKMMMKIYHGSSFALAGLVPAAMVIRDGNLPVDLALGVALPVHSHIGLNFVISDYVPKSMRLPARASVLGVTVASLYGMFQLNMYGEGVSKTAKRLWRNWIHAWFCFRLHRVVNVRAACKSCYIVFCVVEKSIFCTTFILLRGNQLR